MAIAGDESGSHSHRQSEGALHYLAKCVLKGSVVLQAVHGHMRSPSSFDVIFGKETSIELVVVSEDGVVQSVCEQTVFGTIKDLAVLRWNANCRAPILQTYGKDLLVVLSDSGKLSFLSFSIEMHRFFPVAHSQLSEPGNSRYQLGRMLAVDSLGSFVAVAAYEGQIALFSVSKSAGKKIVNEKVLYPPEEGEPEMGMELERLNVFGAIWSMCFISYDSAQSRGCYSPVLAVLRHRQRRRGHCHNELLFLEFNIKKLEAHIISCFSQHAALALSVVDVPHLPGFALLFRMGDAILVDARNPELPHSLHRINLTILTGVTERKTTDECSGALEVDDERSFNVAASALLELRDSAIDDVKGEDPMSIDDESSKIPTCSGFICSWSWEPCNSTNPKLIFSLDTGELYILEVSYNDEHGVKVNFTDCLYQNLAFKTLLWVKGGFVVALLEIGDGLVIKVEDSGLVSRSPIQNIAPMLDVAIVDYHNEKQDQIFACCGVHPEGSLRIIRNGVSVEKLLSTASVYEGVTGTWTTHMFQGDSYHSFLVLSFVEETRVLSVGLSFTDVTDAVGFQTDTCTLGCGLLEDGVLVQICRKGVRLCSPTKAAHPEGVPLSHPVCTSWSPENLTVNLGAVGHGLIIVATSNPCFLYMLSARSSSPYCYEIYEIQRLGLQAEVSCISIPQEDGLEHVTTPDSVIGSVDEGQIAGFPSGIEIGKTCVIGTHKPSVELVSFVPNEGFRLLAIGAISLTNTMGSSISGCIPQDVRLVYVDRYYILSGLRNGMLLRFEWPVISSTNPSELPNLSSLLPCTGTSDSPLSKSTVPIFYEQCIGVNMMERPAENSLPIQLQLIAVRRIGVSPVILVPLCESLHADIIALSDRPWLLQTARHSQRIAYTSISFQPATHATPVCLDDCPSGVLFVAENSLHLVEMVHTKRLNVQKFGLGGTPRRVLYHSESRTLQVLRTDCNYGSGISSDICCVDPLSGSVLSGFKFDPGETAKCMQLMKLRNEQVLVVGTSISSGPAIMPNGEAESIRGRLIVFGLDHMQHSDSSSLASDSKLGSSSQLSSPFREIVGYATEQLSCSSICSSPDDASGDGVKLEECEACNLRVKWSFTLPGVVLAICPYLDRYILVSAGNNLFVYGILNENPQRLRRFTSARTRFTITCITAHLNRIAVGDCRDGLLFYSYQEDLRKLEQLYCDPVQRIVADCSLLDLDTGVVSDRRGNICFLSCANYSEDNVSPERNLTISCSYYVGETISSIRKGSFSYRNSGDGILKGSRIIDPLLDCADSHIVASTLLGSVVIFIRISREEYDLLDAVQARLAVHPLTAPILGNNHDDFRGRGSPVGVPKILDGDMLAQFLELTSLQQKAILASEMPNPVGTSSKCSLPVDQVLRLLERIHNALN
ncbi:splicing factor 3B subunit 3 isoform X1 [Amborella trichopoda]|uniref:DNA damage-binding protein 1 n=1 Tax=Amborella trichopoda TaxID=13333 RepID=W1P339_AMBTC|nr:splicing factor 3B subunit 3 isoform X1 [Amborella trichopoda]ERN01370.1 hypothetical protein AMTR_s00002p00260810 [Amborella trichopoda]|eukprot:XP_020519925.1 splicing factor 3B subunit 3 isoform X1 [Amborella trichopoda]